MATPSPNHASNDVATPPLTNQQVLQRSLGLDDNFTPIDNGNNPNQPERLDIPHDTLSHDMETASRRHTISMTRYHSAEPADDIVQEYQHQRRQNSLPVDLLSPTSDLKQNTATNIPDTPEIERIISTTGLSNINPSPSHHDIPGRSPAPQRTGIPLVKCLNMHKTYLLGTDGVPALRGINLDIYSGEFVVCLGQSGGGKSSLLNILGTIDKPSKGELYLNGTRITSSTPDHAFSRIRLHDIGFIFQQYNLISTMTALENVQLPMILSGYLSRSASATRAKELLTLVGLGERCGHLPAQLSGGEQQRVTICRAIANHPRLLLCDEPTGAVDSVNGRIIMNLLTYLNRKEGLTIVMVTHDSDLIEYAHRVIHIIDGKIVRQQEIDEVSRYKKEQKLKLDIEQDRRDYEDKQRKKDELKEQNKENKKNGSNTTSTITTTTTTTTDPAASPRSLSHNNNGNGDDDDENTPLYSNINSHVITEIRIPEIAYGYLKPVDAMYPLLAGTAGKKQSDE